MEIITFKKDGGQKLIDVKSSLIPILLASGWKNEGELKVDEVETDDAKELAELKALAEAKGIKVHHKAGVEKIKVLLAEVE